MASFKRNRHYVWKKNLQRFLFYIYKYSNIYNFLVIFRASFANVLLGAHQLYQYDDNHLTLKSTKFYIHPQYNASRIKNDIGLIELPKVINFTSDFMFFFLILLSCIWTFFLKKKSIIDFSSMIHFLESISPVCLPMRRSADYNMAGEFMVAAGWGKTSTSKFK